MTIKCRSCGSLPLYSIILLGDLPLANGFLTKKQHNEPRHNLEVLLCESCGLAQLKDLVDPKDLFSDYIYFSSNSEGMLYSAAALVARIQPTLSNDGFVVEIASNDGYLLKNYRGVEVLGIDPAANIAKIANEAGIHTLCDFFSEALAANLVEDGKKADIIHANNVMAHVPDLNGFVKGIKLLLKDKGQAIIEVPHLLDLLEKFEFDTIYHEHVYYFGIKPLKILLQRHKLEIFNVEKIYLHGGTLRLFVGHQGQHPVSMVVEAIASEEERVHLYKLSSYQKFMQHIDGLKNNLLTLLKSLKSENKRVAAYGASAKGTTLLNYFGIGSDYLDFVVDKSPAKQRKLTPGTHLEIRSPSELRHVDYAVLLTWNFADEIIQQQSEFLARGGNFILPLPEVKILI